MCARACQIRHLLKSYQDPFNLASKFFTADITPLILAAHKDNYEIIKILLDRGEQIPEPVSFEKQHDFNLE